MKNKFLDFILIQLFFLFIFFNENVIGQTNIPNTTPILQNFDGMAATLNLPSNWRIQQSGTPTWAGGSTTVGQQASSGTPATGASYNWGSTAAERALGVMTSGGYASPNSVMAWYRNTNASNITQLSVSYSCERYRRNSAAASVQFFYSTNGSTWTAVTAGDVAAASLPTGTSVYGFNPPNLVVNVASFNISSLSIANNADIYLRWNLNTTGSNSQGIGIDDVSVTATFAGVCAAPTQATNVSFGSVLSTSMSVSWTNGTGAGRVVIMNTSNSFTTPTTGSNPAANSVWANAGEQVVYNGTGSTVGITGLTASTNYWFKVFEYCSPDRVYQGGTGTNNPNNQTTAAGTTTPTLTSPNVSTITNTSAILGATVSSDGGAALSARGTVYSTTSPVTSGNNPLAEGGTGVTAFTHSRSPLSPQTLYYYAGYATNVNGTSLSPESNFYTYSNPPTAQATALSATAISSSQINLAWTGATFPGAGATVKGYILISAIAPLLPTLSSSNGQAPAAGVGSILSSAIAQAAVSFSNTALSSSTTYNYLLVPFCWDGTNAGTYNYLTTSAPTANATTLFDSHLQNFGTGTGSHTTGTSTVFLPNPTLAGTTFVRVGTGGGSINLENPGLCNIGSTTELRAAASSSTSVNKFTPFRNYSAGQTFFTRFKLLLGNASGGVTGTNGNWTFYQGDGAMYDNNNDFAGADVFTGLRWTFASSAITTEYRNGGSWSAVLGTPFAQAQVYLVEIVGNNSASTVNYTYGSAQSVAANTFDLFVNGTLVGNNLNKANLANTSNINDVCFIGQSSTSNLANIFVDDMSVVNSIPSTITPIACDLPSVQASNITFSSVATGSFTSNWTNGNGSKRIVVINTVNSFTGFGIDGTDPSANAVYGGSGEQVVYNGSGSSVSISGLTPSTNYWIRVYEANCSGAPIIYNTCTATNNPSNQTTLNTSSITTGTILGSPFCVSAAVNIPFTYTPGSVFTNGVCQFTAQLSDAAGLFGSPTNINTIFSDETGTQSISGNIPSGAITGTGYRIRVISTTPSVTGSDNGVNLSINNSSLTVAPSGNQTIAAGNNGTTLNVTEGFTPTSRQWKYGTSSGGPYTTNLGTTALQIPNFALAGTYYIVCESTFGAPCNNSVVSNEVQITVTGGNPVVLTTTVSSITQNSANSGGNVTSEGGYLVTTKGVVWGTSANPTVPNINSTNDGSGIGVFSSSLTGLNAQTQYYYRAYATNSFGTAYGTNSNFYTHSNPPVSQAANLFANAFSSSQIDLTWDPAVFPISGATIKGYLLIRAIGPATPVFTATNGQAPTVGGGSAIVSSSIAEFDISYSHTGLGGNLTYNYLLIPYCWDGVHAQTYNYLTSGALTASAVTPPGACAPPSTQTSGIVFSSITPNQMTISFTNGDGDGRMVIVATSPISTVPTNGIAPVANSAFGGGDNLGSFNYVAYRNSGSSFTLTNLTPSTTYYFAVFEYKNSGVCYLLNSPLLGNQITASAPSVIETFEPGVKGSYTNGTATCNLGVWNFNDALIGTTASDRKNGLKSARIQNTGSISMLFNKTDGIGQITVNHARFGSDAVSTWRLDVSDDGGATYSAWQSPVITSSSFSLTAQVFNINLTGNTLRIRIVKLSGGSARLNIDDISLTDFVSGSTISVSVVAGSPFCVSDVVGSNLNINYVATGTFNSLNVFTAILSDANGSFAIPTTIGSLASSSLTGTIPCVIPAGTFNGSGYRIRVLSSDPVLPSSSITSNPNNLTVFLNPPDVTGFYGSNSTATSVQLGWTLPSGCYDEILVVGKLGNLVTAIPSGNGSAYTANSSYGTGGSGVSLPVNEYCVYKGNGSSVAVSGLTTGSTYYFEVFVRKGNAWSDGVILSIEPYADQIGDFRTLASGNWNVSTTWQRFDGSTWINCNTLSSPNQWPNQGGASGGTPSSINVNIRNGHTVTVTASHSNQPINNLTVNFGGKLFTNSTLLNGNRYLTVYGDIKCFGTIGNGITYDNISFNIEGNPTTVSGTGQFNASRIRKSFIGNVTSNFIVSMNLGLRFAASAGSSGTQIYSNVSGSVFNMTINENCIVTLNKDVGLSGNISIDGIDGEGSGERGGTFTINGTLTIPGTLFSFTDNLVSPVNYIIGTSGIVNCVSVCTGNSASAPVVNGSAAGTCLLRILNGGKLNMTDNEPFNLRSNTTSPYTYNFGLGTVNNTYDFQTGSIVEYSSPSGLQPIQTQLTYSNLLITEGATKIISSTLTANNNITIEQPAILEMNGQNIFIGGDWNNYGTDGFTEGSSGSITFNGSAIQNITCPGGDNFYNLNISNSSIEGVVLRNDITLANDLDLGINGNLSFGPSPVIVTLSKMTASSNTWKGSGTAQIDMSQTNHLLAVGCETPGYSGILLAGSNSTINYNRDNSISNTGGNQDILTGLTYANLSVNGSDFKNTNNNFIVGGNFTIDGPTTIFKANTIGKKLTLSGNLTLSGGGTMDDNCRDNLEIETSGNLTQEFQGQGKNIKCFNLKSTKSAGGIFLRINNGSSLINIKNDFALDFTGTSLFSDSTNTLLIGDDVELGSVGSALANFNFSGTIELNGDNANVDVHISDYAATGVSKAALNNLRVNLGAQSGSLKQTEILPNAGGQTLILKGELEIVQGTNGAEFDLNNNDMQIGGNWTSWNASAFKQGTNSRVIFNGTLNQSLTCAGGEIYNELEVNKNTGLLLLNNNVFVESTLSLQQGKIDLNNNNLELGTTSANGSIAGGNTLSYLITWNGGSNGEFITHVNTQSTSYFLPIGDFTDYSPATINLYNATLSNATLSAKVVDGVHPQLGSSTNYLSRYWTIEPFGISNYGYGITYSYATSGGSEEIGIPANFKPFKYNSSGWIGCLGSSSTFEMGVGSFNPGTLTFTWDGLYSFSDFTGNGNGSPLPITLLSYNALAQGNVVVNTWKTASEINNDYFNVERSANGQTFESIGTVDCAGNSNQILDYSFVDYSPLSGTSYYRLKQTDFDGTVSYSNLVAVNFNHSNQPVNFSAILNPYSEELLVLLGEDLEGETSINLYDISGKLIYTSTIISSGEAVQLRVPFNYQDRGLYLLHVNNSKQNKAFKFVK
jgi:hypothetical protein